MFRTSYTLLTLFQPHEILRVSKNNRIQLQHENSAGEQTIKHSSYFNKGLNGWTEIMLISFLLFGSLQEKIKEKKDGRKSVDGKEERGR